MVRRQGIPAITGELYQVLFKHRGAADETWTSDIYTPKPAIVSRIIVVSRERIIIPRSNQNEYQAARRVATEAYNQYVEELPTKPTT
jgi:hypothetical protein